MNPIAITIWSVYALVFAGIVSFLSQRYENFMHRRQRKRELEPVANGLETSTSDHKTHQGIIQMAAVRGYDSDELFREDLWLRRIASSRQKLATIEMPLGRVDQIKQLCAMLVQHPGATSDN
jgi:hypothetical protein